MKRFEIWPVDGAREDAVFVNANGLMDAREEGAQRFNLWAEESGRLEVFVSCSGMMPWPGTVYLEPAAVARPASASR